MIFEDAVGYFLAHHYMEEMVSGCTASKEMKIVGEAGPDFIIGDAYIEVNIPDAILNAAGDGWNQVMSLMVTAGQAVRHKNMVLGLEDEKRPIFLTVLQHGLNDRMEGFLCRELGRFFGEDMQENSEFWVVDLKLEPDGIILVSYKNVTDRVMLE